MKPFEYKKLSKLLEENEVKDLTYADLLSTLEWKEFRDKIVKRDRSSCRKCGEFQNTYAWELKGSAPFDIFIRPATSNEQKHLNADIIHSLEKITLNVHHKHYIKGNFPWEYKEDDLITVCEKCHTKIHETEQILIFDKNLKTSKAMTNCSKCSGTGHLKEYHYYQNGICFDCNGKEYS